MTDQDNNSKCTIAVDAMGGDFAPLNAVAGAVEALNEDKSFELLLVGDKNKVMSVLNNQNLEFDEEKIVSTSEIIEMSDSPVVSVKTKKDSSIVVGSNLVKNRRAAAFVSAGNTGAMTVSSILNIGRVKGVLRPTLTAPFPNSKNGYTFISDVGAFVDSKAEHIVGYAILSSIFIEEIYGIKNPSVGLLNVGEEESKGYKLTTEAKELLSKAPINFIGNVEGKDIFSGKADLIVCDGFIGNILLKFAESIIPFLKTTFKNYAEEGLLKKLRIGMLKTPLKEALKNASYELQGGLPLLGVNGISIIGHGISSSLAIKNMVLRAKEMHDKNIIQKFEDALEKYANK